MKRLLIALIIAMPLLACQTTTQRMSDAPGPCGDSLPRAWAVVSAPADATALKALVRANTPLPRAAARWAWKRWFVEPGGQVMLCMADDDPARFACQGEWWIFDRSSGTPEITKTDSWACVI